CGDPRLLADPVRGGKGGTVLSRLRAAAPDETLSARVARHAGRDRRPLLLLLARSARDLADPRADPLAVHLAVRSGDSAAALSHGHPATVRDVALSDPGDHRARAVDLRVRVGAGQRDSLRDRFRGDRSRGVLPVSAAAPATRT